jgi:hypothetical protein
MFSEIKFSDTLSIYKYTINDIDNEQLIKDLYFNLELSKLTNINVGVGEWDYRDFKTSSAAGIQSRIIVNSFQINKLKQLIHNSLILFLKLETLNYKYNIMDWIYISDNDNPTGKWHNHLTNGINGLDTHIQTHNLSQWTITYYAQMPDGLKNNDGKLFVKDKNDNEFSILPKEGECILFPSHVLHKPETNQTSTKSRIVFASHFTIFNENSFSIKTNKSIL